MEQMQEFETEARNDLIEGRNAVIEALRAGRTIDKIFIAKGDVDKTLGHIASKARSAGIVVTEADRRKLDAMSQTHAHQGVIALCAVKEYSTIEDMLAVAAERGEAPFLVLCDEISDPHNLGAIIRTAECVGAHGGVRSSTWPSRGCRIWSPRSRRSRKTGSGSTARPPRAQTSCGRRI